jgi:hypothetical protein
MSTMTIDQMFVGQPVARPRSSVRLTRRGRAVVVLLALLAVLAVGVVVASGSVATGEAGTPEPTRVVLVGPGDTLWGIASAVADDGDVRAMIDRIEDLNALESGSLESGQRLLVPLD